MIMIVNVVEYKNQMRIGRAQRRKVGLFEGEKWGEKIGWYFEVGFFERLPAEHGDYL
jgi:hypothetical protein